MCINRAYIELLEYIGILLDIEITNGINKHGLFVFKCIVIISFNVDMNFSMYTQTALASISIGNFSVK